MIELLIVITIIGILVVVFLPTITSGPARARDAQRVSDVADISNAVEMFNQDHEAYPNTSGAWVPLETPSDNDDITAIAAYFDKGVTPTDPRGETLVEASLDAGMYYYRDYDNGFIVVANTETDKFTDGYYTSDILTVPTPDTTLATDGNIGDDNLYAYYK